MFGLTTSQVLGLAVIAALVTTVGNLLATWLKEFLFVRSFEKWKERQALLSIYRRHRDPIVRAAEELSSRVEHIIKNYPPDYLQSSVLKERPRYLRANLARDPYFKRYRLISSAYRLCALLGWLELYRQEVTFLDTRHRSVNKHLEEEFEGIRSALADGQLNKAPDLEEWSDRLIFREEQRAIGEGMITGTDPRMVLGYGGFCLLFERALATDAAETTEADEELWWVRVAYSFLLDLEYKKDFRRSRLDKMQKHLGSIKTLPD